LRQFACNRIQLCAYAAVGLSLADPASAGGIAVREQSTRFLGSAFAGSAAGTDISSMFWNSAAAASLPGCNSSSNLTVGFGRADETALAGQFVTGIPAIAPGLTPTSTDVGSVGYVSSAYATCQLSDNLFLGFAINAPFGSTTKPDDAAWAGSPIAITSKTLTFDFNPTLAYRLSPELTIGVGLQVEFMSAKITHGAFGSLVGARSFDGNDWGVGATLGIIWHPSRATSIGLGYRSAVNIDLVGQYFTTAGLFSGPAISTKAVASLTLPDELTLSARHRVTQRLSLLGTVEWQNWSRFQNISAVGLGCAPMVCETLNLNYRDGWFYAIGAEYTYNPSLMLRAGLGYELSPIHDGTRDILLPDSNRVYLSIGGSYKYSDNVMFDVGYAHVFFEDGTFCIANAAANGGTSHCRPSTPPTAILLSGRSEVSVDVLSLGLRYKF
jgi:long-chain fatty acid transport protein